MSFLHRTIGTASVALVALVGVNLPAMAGTVTISGSNLGGLIYQNAPNGDPNTSASFTGGVARLATDDIQTDKGFNQLRDTATVIVNNGTSGASFGNLSNLIAQGAAGYVSFNMTSASGGNGNSAYFAVFLVDPNNASKTLQINAWGNGVIGANFFDQGSAVHASTSLSPDGTVGGVFPRDSLWADLAKVVDDGTALGNWQVSALGITTGAFGSNQPIVDEISSITVPVAAVPEASTWAMMVLGFAGLGFLTYRRNGRKSGKSGLNFRLA